MANRSDERSVRRAYRGSGLARKARPPVATNDIAPATRRARLSYRRAAELFEARTADYSDGLYTLHLASFPPHPTLRRRRVDSGVAEVVRHTSVRSLVKCVRVSDDGLRRYQANSDPDREAAGR
ncbi:hypothetical protein [Nocardia nova]